MNFIKRLIPNYIKQEGKYLLLDILKIPYSRFSVPLEILNWLPKNKSILLLDIGANTGQFTANISGEYKIERAVLVEPVQKLIPIIRKRFPNDKVFQILNVAVAEKNCEADFFLNEDFHPISSLLKIHVDKEELSGLNIKEPSAIKIQTLTLDDVFVRQQLNYVDLLKIDVQGAEHLVLQSGIEALKHIKLIYTEFSFKPLYDQSSTFTDLYNILYSNNFVLINISRGYTAPNGELLQGDALFINKKFIN